MWSDHPRSAGSAEATGVLVQQQEGECPGFIADAPAPPAACAGPPLCGLHFTVRYRLFEYASFMWQHGRFLIRRRRVGFPAGWYLLVKSTALAVLNFILLGRSRRTYEFTIDEHGIVRSTSSGVTLIDWDDVATIRSYKRGFMMVLNRGTLPIPYRCLDVGQVAALRGLADARKALSVA